MITAAVLWLAVTPGLAEAGVDASGQFTTDVAVKVPSYHGLQPGLALHYQSGGPDGWLGVGWTLQGTSTITRQSGVHGLPTWTDADDHSAIDGMDLIACAGASARVQSSPSCAHPVAGTVAYTTTIESYKRIAFTPDGSGGTWTVWNPDGVTATYRPVTTTASGAGSDGTTALPATRFGKTPGYTTADWLPLATSSLTGLASNWPTGPADAGRWDETLNGGLQGTVAWPTPGGHVSWLLGDLNRDERRTSSSFNQTRTAQASMSRRR